jgi:hypothetical protein
VWTETWNVIDQNNMTVDRLVKAIDNIRAEIKRVLKALD